MKRITDDVRRFLSDQSLWVGSILEINRIAKLLRHPQEAKIVYAFKSSLAPSSHGDLGDTGNEGDPFIAIKSYFTEAPKHFGAFFFCRIAGQENSHFFFTLRIVHNVSF